MAATGLLHLVNLEEFHAQVLNATIGNTSNHRKKSPWGKKVALERSAVCVEHILPMMIGTAPSRNDRA